jgi:hypothetical protein
VPANASGRIGDAAADAAGKNRSHGTPRHGSYWADGKDFDLLIDINRKMQEGKGRGYEHWAKIFNVKQMSKVLIYLQEHDIRDYDDLLEKAKPSAAKKEMMNYQIAKQDVDRFLKIDEEQGRQQEKTR